MFCVKQNTLTYSFLGTYYFFIICWSGKTRCDNIVNLRLMLCIPKWHQDSCHWYCEVNE